MRATRIAFVSGGAAIALAGLTGMALAQAPATHVLTLRLPDGRLEQVRYAGDVPPTVILSPDAATMPVDPVSPFALLARMSADMDRQAAALFRTFGTLTGPDARAFGVVPALSGPGVCMRSVQISFAGDGQAPHVVSRTAGDCGSAQGGKPTPAVLPNAPAPAQAPPVIQAKAGDPGQGLVRVAGDWRR